MMMALVSDLNKAVAEATLTALPTVSIFARRLRDANLISKKGRGRGAAHATPLDCARLLIALLANSSAKDAPERVRDFGGLVSQSMEMFRRNKKSDGGTEDVLISNLTMANAYGLAEHHTFEQAFAAVIAGFAEERFVSAYSQCDYPPHLAVVVYDTGLAAQIILGSNRYVYRHKDEIVTHADGRVELGDEYSSTIEKYKPGIDSRREIGIGVLRKIALVVNGREANSPSGLDK